MQINWNQNPLRTQVILDDNDKEKLFLRLKIDHLLGVSRLTRLKLVKGNVEEALRTLKHINPSNCDLEEKVSSLIDTLLDIHCGDCTCVATSCEKCYAEDLLRIDTIKGLRKYSGYILDGMFKKHPHISDVLNDLKEPIVYEKTHKWKIFSNEQFEKFSRGWADDRKATFKWLEQYKSQHGF